MNLQKLYLTKVLPHLSKFKMCEIYGFEIKKIEQQLAESFNKKNIHEALDIPDFKHVKNKKILPEIIKTAIKKLKIVDEFENEKNGFLKEGCLHKAIYKNDRFYNALIYGKVVQ
mgnify:CR=1 FL=1